jgi:hypothetical protein
MVFPLYNVERITSAIVGSIVIIAQRRP